MVDYKKYLSKGIKAAEKAEANKNEIQAVFDELNKQLDEVTNGRVTIERLKFFANSTIADIANIANFRPRETYSAITATNKKVRNSPNKELARWKMDRNGYPCRIILGSDEMYCEDKTALERSLQVLLSDPVVGDVLYKLMQMEDDSEEDQEPGGDDRED